VRGYLGVGNRVSLKEGENNLEDVLWWVESHVHLVSFYQENNPQEIHLSKTSSTVSLVIIFF